VVTDNGVVGRFTPAYFSVVPTHGCPDSVTPANSFTYSRQPFRVTVTPYNALGATTLNYTEALGFAKAVTISDPSGATNCPASNCFANHVIASSAFVNVSGVVSGSTNPIAGPGTPITYTFPNKETARLTLTLRATDDPDGVNSDGYDASTTVDSGRVHIFNAYGSELVGLFMPMLVEHYSSADGWVKNTGDTCTSVPANTLSLTNGSTPPPVTPPSLITVGTKTTTVTVANSPFLSGDAGLSFIAPGAGGEGYVDVSANLSAKTWLQFDWDGNGTDDDPTAKATFGIYKGNPRHIYFRERY
jgi:MSHA biogenesis protein MshQ